MIVCSKCKESKTFEAFSRDSQAKNNCQSACKSCKIAALNPGQEITRKKAWYEANKVEISIRAKTKWAERQIGKVKCIRVKGIKSPRKPRTPQTLAQKAHKKEYDKIYITANLKKVTERVYAYKKARLISDPLFAFTESVRNVISCSFRRSNKGFAVKSKRTEEILCCSFSDFRAHIERQFNSGMEWNNAGEWHLDHIVPLSSATTNEEIIGLCHWSNFQPLWAKDNISKGSRLNWKAA